MGYRYACVRARSHPALCNAQDCSLPGSSLHGFSLPEYWSGLPFPLPGDLPDSGIKPMSPASPAWISLPLSHLGSPRYIYIQVADSLHYTTETNTTTQHSKAILFQLTKKKKKKGKERSFARTRTGLQSIP